MLRSLRQRTAVKGIRQQTKNNEKFNKNKRKDLEGKNKIKKGMLLENSTYKNVN